MAKAVFRPKPEGFKTDGGTPEGARSLGWAQSPLGQEVYKALHDNGAQREVDHIQHMTRVRDINPQTGSPRYGLPVMLVADIPADRLDAAGIKKIKSVNGGIPRVKYVLRGGKLVKAG